MAPNELPRRPRDPRTGETPEPPGRSRADDPTHGVDPRRDRPMPGERPGLSGRLTPLRGAMQGAENDPSYRIAPTIWLALFLAALLIAALLIWA